MSATNTFAPAQAAARFDALIEGLKALVWSRSAFLGFGIAGAIINYLGRVAARFARAMHRLERGTPSPPARPRAQAQPDPTADRPPPPDFHVGLIPRTRAWLILRLKHEAAIYRYQLLDFLNDPQIAQAIAAANAARHLRRTAHLLGAPLPQPMRTPPRPRRKRPRKPTAREQRDALWYPNIEGKPIDLYKASRDMDPARRRRTP